MIFFNRSIYLRKNCETRNFKISNHVKMLRFQQTFVNICRRRRRAQTIILNNFLYKHSQHCNKNIKR